MAKVFAIFNVDTNSKFKQRLEQDLEIQRKDRRHDASFAMFMKYALQEKKVKNNEQH
jgi:hypothetical protein